MRGARYREQVRLDPEKSAQKAEYERAWRDKNREQYNEYQRDYQREYQRKRMTHLRATSPTFRLNNSIRSNMRHSLKSGKQGLSWESLVGYTLSDLKAHLESMFSEGMSWESYGKDGWHVDHIRPIASFDFESHEDPDFKDCWSLENLQPLWAQDNLKKGKKYHAE